LQSVAIERPEDGVRGGRSGSLRVDVVDSHDPIAADGSGL
jgi:hypothetical protein